MSFKTVTIESSRFGWGLFPEVGSEDSQKLSINNRGSVYFTAYGWENYAITRKERLNIGKEKAKRILDLLYGFVADTEDYHEATDVAYWRMKAVAEDGMEYDISGPATNWVEYNGENISDLVRTYIPIEELIVFGEAEEEDETEWDGLFYREKPTNKIWWLDTPGRVGEWLFTFDKVKIYNMFRDYPWELTPAEKKIFDEENPYWADFFKSRNE